MNRIRPIVGGRTTADFFTEGYRLSASALVYKRNLIDVLGDRSTNYLDLVDIYISRINEPGDIVATYQKGSLIKDEISFVMLSSEAETVSKERFYIHNRSTLPLFITLPSFEISGKFQWLGEFDIRKIMESDSHKFLTMLDATISNSLFPKITFKGPAVLINKAKVDVICMGEPV